MMAPAAPAARDVERGRESRPPDPNPNLGASLTSGSGTTSYTCGTMACTTRHDTTRGGRGPPTHAQQSNAVRDSNHRDWHIGTVSVWFRRPLAPIVTPDLSTQLERSIMDTHTQQSTAVTTGCRPDTCMRYIDDATCHPLPAQSCTCATVLGHQRPEPEDFDLAFAR